MGTLNLPPGAISLPGLARVMGIKPDGLYQAIRKGRGPAVTPVEPSPTNYYRGSKSNVYTTFDAALEWLETYKGRNDYTPAIRTLQARRSIYRAFHEPRRAA
jgi:hypothetical protein